MGCTCLLLLELIYLKILCNFFEFYGVNNRLETSEEYTAACLRLYEFEQGSRDKFWKRFVQWHSKWWV